MFTALVMVSVYFIIEVETMSSEILIGCHECNFGKEAELGFNNARCVMRPSVQ